MMLAALALAPQVVLAARATYSAQGGAPDAIELQPEKPFSGELHRLTQTRQDFEFEVPEGSVFLCLKARSPAGDVDLFTGPGEPPDDLEFAPLSSMGATGVERLVADRLGETPISAGTWWASVATPEWDPLRDRPASTPRLAYTLELVILAARTDAVLAPGEIRSFSLDPDSGGFRTFRIDVPKEAQALRVDLHRVPANLDLFARIGRPMTTLETAQARARNEWGAETLLISRTSKPSLVDGPWFVDVMDALTATAVTPFEIRVSFDEAPPPEWSKPPVLLPGDPAKPLSRALAATLEVFSDGMGGGGGSATLVTSDGLLLSNAHVVDRGDGTPVESLVFAANLDPRRPPEEAFRGKVVRFDAKKDLALLQIDRTFYGAPLPQGYRFPTVELGREEDLAIGDPLWIVGYPSLGGTGSRVSIHCARGVLSGFSLEESGLLVKTDASVIPGNSGGAALDERGRLIGVPSLNVYDEFGSVGLIAPLSLLSADWRAEIDARRAR